MAFNHLGGAGACGSIGWGTVMAGLRYARNAAVTRAKVYRDFLVFIMRNGGFFMLMYESLTST